MGSDFNTHDRKLVRLNSDIMTFGIRSMERILDNNFRPLKI